MWPDAKFEVTRNEDEDGCGTGVLQFAYNQQQLDIICTNLTYIINIISYNTYSELIFLRIFNFDQADGGWSSFGSYSSCSASCGGGIKTRARSCTNPKSFGGGSACRGSNTQTVACNTNFCSGMYRVTTRSVQFPMT